uniref:F-box domain-containing protein n=1 Tax=Scylla olivacea TaxID=85551 RepID=A0A0P4W836_SCYOL
MAPRVPDEIDVFTAPHSRMKELVNIYTRKMSCVDFRDVPEVVTLLQDLDTTLREFKSHESIENIFIMDQLRNRLKQHQISNTAVCDCHNDNQLSDVVQLVRRGTQVRERSVGERITFGLQLQQAFQAFVNTFLPHMEEEEQVFQPMLVEYFEYEELKVLREIVLKEHELAKERWHVEKAQDLQEGQPETHSSVKDLRDLDWDLCSLTEALDGQEAHDSELGSLPPPLPLPPEQPPLPPDHYLTQDPSATNPCPDLHSLHPQTSCHTLPHHTQDPDSYSLPYPDCQTDHYLLPDYQDLQYHQDLSFDSQTHHIPSQDHSLSLSPCAASSSSTPTLPTDVLVEIFRYLVPPDLGRCAQVCSAWNSAVFSPTLWPAIFPVQWARGIWEWHDVGLCGVLEDEAFQQQQQGCGSRKWDEDADVDETEEGEESTEAVWECRVMERCVWWWCYSVTFML